ncbi:hypothetical protein CEXT_582161 [Caerostris extrusa]|uniref:Uncharacterized protein n=1 Tax=Caerostris extrusa TaxID=172846 RepID=A0AAV4MCT1_CAEEX|nr:hypothetical protein CEXT_582161 [Caerostris extrusa]
MSETAHRGRRDRENPNGDGRGCKGRPSGITVPAETTIFMGSPLASVISTRSITRHPGGPHVARQGMWGWKAIPPYYYRLVVSSIFRMLCVEYTIT